MTKKTSYGHAKIAVAAGVLALGAATSAWASPCNGLSGYYGNVTLMIVGSDGKTVNGTSPVGTFYGTCTASEINFYSPHFKQSYTGAWNGTTASWNNNTTWTKVKQADATGDTGGYATPAGGPCNGLSGYYGNISGIVVGKDGTTVNVALADGRPNAYGTCSGNRVTVNYTDFGRTTTGTFDGKVISWSDGTTWTKR